MENAAVSENKLVGIFTLVLIGGAILVMLVTFLMEMLMNRTFSNNAMGVLIVMYAAMMAGQYYFKQTKTMPESRFSWKMAGKFTFVNVCFSLLWLLLFVLTGDLKIPQVPSNEDIMVMLVVLAIIIVLPLLLTRLGFFLGARSARKQMELLAAKKAKTDTSS